MLHASFAQNITSICHFKQVGDKLFKSYKPNEKLLSNLPLCHALSTAALAIDTLCVSSCAEEGDSNISVKMYCIGSSKVWVMFHLVKRPNDKIEFGLLL